MLRQRAGIDPEICSEWEQVYRSYYDAEMDQTTLASWHEKQLKSVLNHVAQRSPFYAEHLGSLIPARATLDTLDAIPFTTKSDLRSCGHDILSGAPSSAAVYYETTGTTGPPTPCPRAPIDVELSNYHVAHSWARVIESQFGDRSPVIGLMGPAELYAFADTFSDVTADLGMAHVKIWPESPRVGFRKALRLIQELGVEVLVCAPALCLNLARAAIHNGLDPQDLGIKQFLVLGEVCTPEFMANVRGIWGASVTPILYGSQEAMAIATGCPEGSLHLAQPNYLAEVLDNDQTSLGTSGSGELCLTMLVEGIKPLIRYRTGDHVSLGERECGCGHPGDVLDVLGRVDDGVTLGAARMQPAELESLILHGVEGCLGYQVVITAQNELKVNLCLEESFVAQGPRMASEIAERLQQRCAMPTKVQAVADLDPITNTGAYVSWKAARISDERSADPLSAVARQHAAAHEVTT